MTRRHRLELALVAVLVTSVVLVRTGQGPGRDAGPPVAGSPRAATVTELGVFRGSDPADVTAFERWLGRDVDLVVDFLPRASWSQIADPQPLLDTWQGTPYRKVFSVGLLPQDDPTATVERGADGEYDRYYRELARRLVASGQPDATLRLGWEFNLAGSRWATPDSQAFIHYWRNVVATMRAQPGQRFRFDWNPNNGAAEYDAVNYYPGDDVVDYVGVDAYDTTTAAGSYPYPPGCDPGCRLQHQQQAWNAAIYGGDRGLAFWSRFASQHGKPMSLPEWGLWNRPDGEGGGEDLFYLQQMAQFIGDPRNHVADQSYFEFDGPDGGHRLMVTFPAAGRAFQALFGPR